MVLILTARGRRGALSALALAPTPRPSEAPGPCSALVEGVAAALPPVEGVTAHRGAAAVARAAAAATAEASHKILREPLAEVVTP